jgi:hypothetical protein
VRNLPDAVFESPLVRFAIGVSSAVSQGNYVKYFKLFRTVVS